MIKRISFLGLTLLSVSTFLLSCDKNDDKESKDKGYVFTMSNAATANELIQYKIDGNGSLQLEAKLKTGGDGSANNLESQGAVSLSADKKFVFAVNAGNNSVSSFKISSDGTTTFAGKYNLVGKRPISVSERAGLVYVLNSEGAKGASSIEGFTLNAATGALTAISNSQITFAADVDPSQVSFVYDNVIVITEKATNIIASYTLNATHVPTNRQTITSQATTPFGFAVGKNGRIFVTEASAMSSVSSYAVATTGAISKINTVANNQGGACWAVLNNTESLVYVTNAGSNTVSSFNINSNGNLTATQIAANLGAGNAPLDLGINRSNQYVYVLAFAGNKVLGYTIKDNLLTPITGATMTVPATSFGLAVY